MKGVESQSVYVVVLNWNSFEDTEACLKSLGDVTYGNLHIVVVDNGSVDGSLERLKEAFPSVPFIATGRNLGFAGGVNVGIEYAMGQGADFVLLLNNDTVVAPDFVDRLVEFAADRPEAAIMCSKIYFHHAPERIWYAGARFLSWIGFTHLRGCRRADAPRYSVPIETEPTGCSMLIRTELFSKIGLFDEDYFCYCEDVDLGRRAGLAGYRTYLVPSSKVWHKVAETSKDSLAMLYYIVRNSLRLADTYHQLPYWLRPVRYGLVAITYTLFVLITQRQRLKALRRIYQGMRDYLYGRYGEFRDA